MSEIRQDDDALLRALFEQASRPPMGDEAFTRGVMARIGQEKARREGRFTAVAAAGALAAAVVAAPVAEPLGLLVRSTLEAAFPLLASAPEVGAGGMTVLLAFAMAAAGWIYAERS